MYDQRIHYSVKHYTSMVFFLLVKATSTTLRQTVLHNDPVASQDHYARFRIRTRDLCFCRLVGLIGVISMCHSLFVENIRTADVKTAYLYSIYSTPKKDLRHMWHICFRRLLTYVLYSEKGHKTDFLHKKYHVFL